MTVGRRPVFLALGFFIAALVLSNGALRAQPPFSGKVPPPPPGKGVPKNGKGAPNSHPWDHSLTPDDIQRALSRLGQGGLDPEREKQLQQLMDQLKGNPELLEQLKKKMQADPEIDKLMKEKAKEQGGSLSPEEIEKLLEQFKSQSPGTPLPNDKKAPPPLPKFPEPLPDFKLPKTGPGEKGPPPPFNPPKIAPPTPVGPMSEPPIPPPGIPPLQGGPMNPPLPPPNPFGQPDVDPRAKSMSELMGWWEKNIGPLDETPEVRRTLLDLESSNSGLDLNLKGPNDESFLDWLKSDSSGDLDNILNGSGSGSSDWNLPKFDLPDWGAGKWFGGSSSSTPNTPPASTYSPSSGGSSGSGLFSGWGSGGGVGGSWLPFALLGLAILGAVIMSWWYLRDPASSVAGSRGAGLGPWPLDPRAINTRQDVVKAFEYLSVLLCGPSARMWTHGTVAEALSGLAVTAEDTAMKLARLYELARYAPIDEPLTRPEVIEARHLVCDLAGVS